MKTAILKDVRPRYPSTLQYISIGLFWLIYVEVLITVTLLAVTGLQPASSSIFRFELTESGWLPGGVIIFPVSPPLTALTALNTTTSTSHLSRTLRSADFKDLSICISVVVNNPWWSCNNQEATNTNRIWYTDRDREAYSCLTMRYFSSAKKSLPMQDFDAMIFTGKYFSDC